MSGGYYPPELLAAAHDLTRFECRSREQTNWLRRHARQSAASSATKVFVVTDETGHLVVAYYAWCMAQLAASAAPERLRKGAGRYPQPVALQNRRLSLCWFEPNTCHQEDPRFWKAVPSETNRPRLRAVIGHKLPT